MLYQGRHVVLSQLHYESIARYINKCQTIKAWVKPFDWTWRSAVFTWLSSIEMLCWEMLNLTQGYKIRTQAFHFPDTQTRESPHSLSLMAVLLRFLSCTLSPAALSYLEIGHIFVVIPVGLKYVYQKFLVFFVFYINETVLCKFLMFYWLILPFDNFLHENKIFWLPLSPVSLPSP